MSLFLIAFCIILDTDYLFMVIIYSIKKNTHVYKIIMISLSIANLMHYRYTIADFRGNVIPNCKKKACKPNTL